IVAAGLALAALPSLLRALRAGPVVVPMLVAGALANTTLIAAFQPWNHAYWVFVPAVAGALIACALPPLPARTRRAAPFVLAAVALVNLGRALPATRTANAPYADLISFGRTQRRSGYRLLL